MKKLQITYHIVKISDFIDNNTFEPIRGFSFRTGEEALQQMRNYQKVKPSLLDKLMVVEKETKTRFKAISFG